jgi:hypothetical protein
MLLFYRTKIEKNVKSYYLGVCTKREEPSDWNKRAFSYVNQDETVLTMEYKNELFL